MWIFPVICLKYVLVAKMETAELPINNHRMAQDWRKSLPIYCVTLLIKLNTVFTSVLLYYTKTHTFTPLYRGADKSLARPERKQATATEDFDVHISYL